MTEFAELQTSGDAAAIIEAAQQYAEPKQIAQRHGREWVAVPSGFDIRELHIDVHAPHPARASGRVNLGDVASLIAYVERHTTDGTTIWVHPERGEVVAVLDDHEAVITEGGAEGEPGWGTHRAHLDLIVTPEWGHWIGRDGELVDQTAFANHIEDGAREITDPSPATMLEVAQNFHAQTAVTFRSAKRLADGQVQVQYDEDVQAAAGKGGQLGIPSEFSLAVAPFVGEPAYALTARLRYRVSGGNLRIGYKLDRPDAVVRDALAKIAERLREASIGPVFIGTPR